MLYINVVSDYLYQKIVSVEVKIKECTHSIASSARLTTRQCGNAPYAPSCM